MFVAERIKVNRDSLGEFSNTSYGVFGAERVQLFTVTHFFCFRTKQMERYFVELQLFMCCSLSAVEPAPDDCGQDILRQAHL